MNKRNKHAPGPKAAPVKSSTSISGWSIRLLLSLLALLLYGNTLTFDYALDDEVLILKNEAVQKGVNGIPEILSPGKVYENSIQPFRPVASALFAIERSLAGRSAAFGHFISLLLYVINLQLLFTLLQRLFRQVHTLFLALIVALFAAHPIHSEVVANIKSQDELLAAAFGLLAWLKFLPKQENVSIGRSDVITGSLYFFLAQLSKESAIAFALIIPASRILVLKQPPGSTLLHAVPLLVLGLIFLWIRSLYVPFSIDASADPLLANVLNGAKNMGETSATKMVILLQFLRAVFLPWPMSWDYSFNEIPVSTWSQLTPWLGLLLYTLLMVVVLFRFRQWPIVSFCILFFFISTSPTNNLFFTTGSTFAERFLYVPSIAFCIVLVFLIAKALKTDIRQFPEHGRRPLFLVVGTLVLAGSVLTVVRASDWRNNKTLFSADILHAPNSTRTHYSLASELMKEAQRSVDYRKRTELLNESAASFDRSIAIHPGNFQAWYNYGLNRALAGDTVKAVNCYRRSIELSPTYQVAMNNLAVIYDAQGATDSAAAWYRRVLALDPDNAVAKSNLSNTYFNQGLRLSQAGRRAEAITAYRKSAASDPSNSIPLNNLASLFASEAQYDSALVYLKKAYSIKPGEMMVIENIAAVSYLDGNYPQAMEFAGKALAIQPNAQRSLGVMADTYQAMGNPAEAMKYLQRLQQIR